MMISGALPRVAFKRPAQSRPQVLSQGLRRVAHQPGQRNDRQRRDDELRIGSNFSQSTMIATGMKTSSQFSFKDTLDPSERQVFSRLNRDRAGRSAPERSITG